MKLKELIYKQIVSEAAANDIIFSHNGVNVVDTNHATEQFLKRFPHKPDMSIFFTNMINRVLKIEQSRSVPEEMLIYSKSLDQAVIVAYRYDRFDIKDNTKHFSIITYLPPGRKKPKPGTFPVLMEYEEGYTGYSTNLIEYLSGIVGSRRAKINESTAQYDYFPISLANGLDYKIILSNNKLFGTSIKSVEID